MLEKAFIIALFTGILYAVFRFVEMKYIDKQMKPLKIVVRDILLVAMASFGASFVYFSLDTNISGLMNVVTDTKTVNPAATQIFTDEPGF
jgi:hypothetical protein